MNTYLPDSDFSKSAEMLDIRKLNRQRSDVLAILRACAEEPPQDDKKEHPAVRMWRGSEQYLIQYGMAVCFEWQARGNGDTLLSKILKFRDKFPDGNIKPEWLGDRTFHESHQSYLLRSLPSWYKDKFENVRDDISVIWPRTELRSVEIRSERERQKAIRRAQKAKERAAAAKQDAIAAALDAGLHPETLEPLTDKELEEYRITIQVIDDDQLKLSEELIPG